MEEIFGRESSRRLTDREVRSYFFEKSKADGKPSALLMFPNSAAGIVVATAIVVTVVNRENNHSGDQDSPEIIVTVHHKSLLELRGILDPSAH